MKTDEFVSDKEIAKELGPEYMSLCSQLTFEADIRISTEKILERRKKESSVVMLKKTTESMNLKILCFWICYN